MAGGQILSVRSHKTKSNVYPVNESRKGPFRLFMVEGISCA